MGFLKFCETFHYADQNHMYSNLLHLIYHVANYLELRHVVFNFTQSNDLAQRFVI